jgi:hypothetical protein
MRPEDSRVRQSLESHIITLGIVLTSFVIGARGRGEDKVSDPYRPHSLSSNYPVSSSGFGSCPAFNSGSRSLQIEVCGLGSGRSRPLLDAGFHLPIETIATDAVVLSPSSPSLAPVSYLSIIGRCRCVFAVCSTVGCARSRPANGNKML